MRFGLVAGKLTIAELAFHTSMSSSTTFIFYSSFFYN